MRRMLIASFSTVNRQLQCGCRNPRRGGSEHALALRLYTWLSRHYTGHGDVAAALPLEGERAPQSNPCTIYVNVHYRLIFVRGVKKQAVGASRRRISGQHCSRA